MNAWTGWEPLVVSPRDPIALSGRPTRPGRASACGQRETEVRALPAEDPPVDVEWLHSLKRQAKDLELVVTGLVLLTVFLLIVFAGSVAPVGK